MANDEGSGYRIWAVDNVVYGPVDLGVLVRWVNEERITPDTWVFSEKSKHWVRAGVLPEISGLFTSPEFTTGSGANTTVTSILEAGHITPNVVRRVRVLSGLSDDQISRFLRYVELQQFRQFADIVKQGAPGDAMYLLMEGEARVRMMIGGKETTLATLAAGDFFGEISIFDHGPRSADVVANTDCAVLKMAVSSFQRLAGESPDLSSSFLLGIGRTLTSRIRADNKRYRESVSFVRAVGP